MRRCARAWGFTWCALIVLIAACSSNQAPVAKRQAPTAPAPVGPAPPPVAPTAPAKSTLTRAELQALLDAWLAAQNDGDFAAYEKLYAAQMRGVKRVGKREARMSRVQWMADRARMFRRPIEVGVRDVRFSGAAGRAQIDFVQVFRQGDFMDSGPKQLVVVERAGAPRILHEEMLESSISVPASVLAERLHLVSTSAAGGAVVLVERADPAWGVGRFVARHEQDGRVIYAQEVSAERVPEGAKWLGTSFRVHDLEGGSCTSAITKLELVLMTSEEWYVDESDPEIAALIAVDRDDGRARSVMRLESPTLVGTLAQCAGAFATRADHEPPVTYLRAPPDAALERRILDATRALPRYQSLEKEFADAWREATEDEPSAPGEPLPEQWAGGGGEVAVFASAAGARFAIASFVASTNGLDLGAHLFALYRLDASGAPTPISVSPVVASPTLLVDVNGDDVPELYSSVAYGMIHAVGSSGLYLIRYLPYLFDDC